MSTRHSVNRTSWSGRYRYAADEAEYVEFCLETGVPAEYSRAVFRDGLPTSFQRLTVNGSGAFPIWRGLDNTKRFREIKSDPGHYFVFIEEYEARDGVVWSGHGLAEGRKDGPPKYFTSIYTHSSEGHLQRIVREWESGFRDTVFAARAKISTRELSIRLSQKIAQRAIEALAKVSLVAPLAGVELLYRSVTDYVPSLYPFTEHDNLNGSMHKDRFIELRSEDFEPEMADFKQRIESSERYHDGTKMLRDAAKLLTKSNAGQRVTSRGFVAFAIDWEFEGHELAKILRDCGADARTLRIWRQRGWLK